MTTGADEAEDRGPARVSRRDSLFLLTILSAPDGRNRGSARVRNLSATGLMADCEKPFTVGERVSMTLRGVGDVQGVIAWVKGDRIGISFDTVIDPQLARKPVSEAATPMSLPDYLRVPTSASRIRR